MDEAEKTRYFSFEPAAFLAEFVGMTREQIGAYTSLVMWLYNNGGRIRAQSKRIPTIMQSQEDFDAIWEVIGEKFVEKEGWLSHPRVTREMARVHKRRTEKRLQAQAAAKARWEKQSRGNADAMPPQCQSEGEGEGNIIIDDDVVHSALNNPIGNINTAREMEKSTAEIVGVWNKVSEKKTWPSPDIDSLIYQLRISTTEPIHPGQIITAIENYGKVLKVRGHTGTFYNLYWFLKKGIHLFKKEAFDMDMWTPKKKGRKPSEVLADDAKRS
jgi:uncharacterized protein YdaU (DUF1376 family)